MAELMRLPDTELEIMKVIWENESNAFYLRMEKGESGGTTPLECFCLADLAEPFD